MKTKIIALKKRLQKIIEPNTNDQERERKAAEYLIISQPNSGRTWLRVLLGNILQELSGLKDIHLENLSYFAELDPKLPYIKAVHERFQRPEDYENKKVILLVRDPRDAVISNYFLRTKRGKNPRWIDKSLSEFIREGAYIDDFIALCNAWKKYRDVPKGFLLLRYEDNRENIHRELKKVTYFLGLQVSDTEIDEAVSRSSFENMRKMELKRKSLKIQDEEELKEESLKTRKGKVGSYQEMLSSEDLEFIENKLQQQLDKSYGYNYVTR